MSGGRGATRWSRAQPASRGTFTRTSRSCDCLSSTGAWAISGSSASAAPKLSGAKRRGTKLRPSERLTACWGSTTGRAASRLISGRNRIAFRSQQSRQHELRPAFELLGKGQQLADRSESGVGDYEFARVNVWRLKVQQVNHAQVNLSYRSGVVVD